MSTDIVGAVLVRDNRILLGLRSAAKADAAACWDLIGGRLEQGETFEQACLREIEEELGVRAVVGDELYRVQLPSGAEYRIFRVTRWSGEPRLANAEHSALAWVTPEEACALTPLAAKEYLSIFKTLIESET